MAPRVTNLVPTTGQKGSRHSAQLRGGFISPVPTGPCYHRENVAGSAFSRSCESRHRPQYHPKAYQATIVSCSADNVESNSLFRVSLPDLGARDDKEARRASIRRRFQAIGEPAMVLCIALALAEAANGILQKHYMWRHVRLDLFKLEDQGTPNDRRQREKSHLDIDSQEWRAWSNPEFLQSDKGIRLEKVVKELRNAVMRVIEASLSPGGYIKAVGAMGINGFLTTLSFSALDLLPRSPEDSPSMAITFASMSSSISRKWFYRHASRALSQISSTKGITRELASCRERKPRAFI
ncbi:hypothetical protein HRG_013004 [Hirsutella rhossiliensis]